MYFDEFYFFFIKCSNLRIIRRGIASRAYFSKTAFWVVILYLYWGADKSLARPGRNQATPIKL